MFTSTAQLSHRGLSHVNAIGLSNQASGMLLAEMYFLPPSVSILRLFLWLRKIASFRHFTASHSLGTLQYLVIEKTWNFGKVQFDMVTTLSNSSRAWKLTRWFSTSKFKQVPSYLLLHPGLKPALLWLLVKLYCDSWCCIDPCYLMLSLISLSSLAPVRSVSIFAR